MRKFLIEVAAALGYVCLVITSTVPISNNYDPFSFCNSTSGRSDGRPSYKVKWRTLLLYFFISFKLLTSFYSSSKAIMLCLMLSASLSPFAKATRGVVGTTIFLGLFLIAGPLA